MNDLTRRQTIAGAAIGTFAAPLLARTSTMPATDLILVNAKVTTLDRENPQAQAIAIRDGRFLAFAACWTTAIPPSSSSSPSSLGSRISRASARARLARRKLL